MNESEWVASDDPAAMLDYLQNGVIVSGKADKTGFRPITGFKRPSKRKLRLWVDACRLTAKPKDGPELWANKLKTDGDLITAVGEWARKHSASWVDEVPVATRAALVREIFGNPFRPVKVAPAWLTPTVLSLAQAAYEERTTEEVKSDCESCNGRGWHWTAKGPEPAWEEDCDHCEDGIVTRRIDRGTLDPHRLAVLSDCLEENGCEDPDILNHLRGKRRCSRQYVPTGREDCDECGIRQSVMHGWVDRHDLCVRGCAVLDATLGLE